MVYDRDGNLVVEADAATGVVRREYIWLGSRPIAVVDGVGTATPVLMHVHVDHLDRPVMMTNATGAVVWRASYLPFGEGPTITGPASLNARFPGQWFMAETGFFYNWHRWYNQALGRYMQPDPLGLEAGANRYAYALNSPLMYTDPDGLMALENPFGIPGMDGINRPFAAESGGGGGGGGYFRPTTRDELLNLCTKTGNQWEYKYGGGLSQAQAAFDSLTSGAEKKSINTTYGPGQTARTLDGTNRTLRPGSSKLSGRPTIVIGRIKIRS
jgi:RHS repeat-associated protein